ncbi:superoxide dismutase [Cu-Zn]-like [Antedon mediterranea]|uniref:superoxide dismutase [Cu-Zn]-like n=1 Tax=Antedon mediterranea TaxID=105859 RepID=UPI003AF571F1
MWFASTQELTISSLTMHFINRALLAAMVMIFSTSADTQVMPDRMTLVEEEMIKLRYDVDRLLEVHNLLSETQGLGLTEQPVYGNCRMMPNVALGIRYYQPITGSINLRQNTSTSALEIKGYLYGFQHYYSRHGFHVHELGDMTHGCNSMGGHYNPLGKAHGPRNAKERHVGDLGNVDVSGKGTINISMEESIAKLTGDNSIIGRGIVLHMGRDDLGTEDNVGSHTTGNAGMRLACCVIGISNGADW